MKRVKSLEFRVESLKLEVSIFYFLFSIFYFLFTGCAKKEVTVTEKKITVAPVPITALIEKKVEEKYVYRGAAYRDPFLPVTERRQLSPLLSTEKAKIPNLGALTLKGIVRDKKGSIALLASPEGSYVVKNGSLYDNLNRLVPGITGRIDKESVTLTTEDKFTKTYKLHELIQP